MLVQVGNMVDGYLVTFIGESDYVELARDSSSDWTLEERNRQQNISYLSCQVEDYDIGDVIRVEEQKIRLETVGNIKFIVTRRRVTKVYANTDAAGNEDQSIEGTGIGSEGGSGLGEESLGEDHRPQD